MINIPKAPKPKEPVLIDRIISFLQDELISGIGWLDHAFGKAQRLVTLRDQREYYYPGVYAGGNEYLNVLPGQGLGNRAFFIVNDPSTLETRQRFLTLKSPVALVCWYDLSRIYPEGAERSTEAVKWQILSLLSGITFPTGMWMSVGRIYEQSENIFKEFSIREIDSQYLMQPFAGIRFELELTYREECL